MCQDNCIVTSWSCAGVFIVPIFVGGGIIAALLGAELTWGEIIILPAILTFLLNKKQRYCFYDSGFTVQRLLAKCVISAEMIQQIDVFEMKSGTWIVVELNGAPAITHSGSPAKILTYCLRHHRETFLIPLRHGERDKALKLLRKSFPQKIPMTF